MSNFEFSEYTLDQLTASTDSAADFADDKATYRIGDLAKEFAVTLRTLRFYEDRGLITPRRAGSTRLYSNKDRARLKMILLAKRVGFSLVDIHDIMDIYDLGETSDKHLKIVLSKFKEQMTVLEEQRVELVNSISELEDTIDSLESML